MSSLLIMAIGFLAQGFFSARILVQWILSERARRVLSPSLFWILSIAGSFLLCVYGWLRNDFAIILGQLISYYIYIWNLNIKGVWKELPAILRTIIFITPFIAIGFALSDFETNFSNLFNNEDIPLWLLIYGSLSQILFTLRFIYQYIYSSARNTSLLPAGFWILSLAGSLCIVTYGLIRHDIVLIVGQSFGLVAYIRNLMILRNQSKRVQQEV
ncbi:MAG: lipid-A-disaccharide synthase N-terminal domain-containing protein [Muribaculaceae bacterium]|nr:lipid-A-disaccharide synthase N-terminal domain-containing protein [Muribaculaceae bacterium]